MPMDSIDRIAPGMMVRFAVAFAAVALSVASANASVSWENVDEGHYIAGRRCSEGYLQGKVVLVSRDPKAAERMESIWTSFKTKQFVLIGAYDMAPPNVTFPVYSCATLAEGAPNKSLYVVDETGMVRYKGDDDRAATESLVTAITDMESPKGVGHWMVFLDYELTELPGRAYLRYLEFKKKFPKEAKEYSVKFAELEKVENVKKLAELVKFAKTAKDMHAFDPKKDTSRRMLFAKKIKEAISKYSFLKESEDRRVVQEAKNALADLKWTLATL